MLSLPKRDSKAFTLLELIVVIVILGILAAIAIPTFQKVVAKSHDEAAYTTLSAFGREAAALAAMETKVSFDAAGDDFTEAGTDLVLAAPGTIAAAAEVVVGTDAVAGQGQVAVRLASDRMSAALSMLSKSGRCVGVTVLLSGETRRTETAACASTAPLPPLTAPVLQGVSAGTGVDLSWSSVEGATSYRLERIGAGAVYTGTATDFTETGLAEKTSYSYTVYAVRSSEAVASNTVTVTTGVTPLNVVDTFDRANNTTTLGVTSDGKATWEVIAGAWGISSNQAYPTAAPALATVDVGSGDVEARLTVAAAQNTGVAFRVVDGNNYMVLRSFEASGTYYVGLQKVVAGTTTNLYSVVSGATQLRASVAGDKIHVILNGAHVTTITDSTHQGASKVGLWSPATGITSNKSSNDFWGAAQSTTSPDTVRQLDITGITTTSVAMKWTTSPVADLKEYRIYRNGVVVGTSATPSYTDPAVPAGTYEYTVAAVDVSGNEGGKAPVQPVVVPGTALLNVVDTFDRVNNTTTLGITSDGKASWQVHSGTWTITNNQAYASAAPAVASVTVGSGDVDARLNVVAARNTGLAFRVVDGSNYMLLRSFESSGTHYVGLQKVAGGTVTDLYTAVSTATQLRVSTSGDKIHVILNGSLAATVTDATHSSATKVGAWSALTGIVSNQSVNDFAGAAQALTSPDTVAKVDVTSTEAGGVKLSWAQNQAADLKEYRVYRDGVVIGAAAAPGTAYTDTTAAAGASHTYTVAAADVHGNEGGKAPTQQVIVSSGLALSVSDTFDRVNSTTSLGVTSDGKASWQSHSGSWTINSNQAYASAGPAVAAVDVGSTTQSVQATVAAANNTGIAVRVVDRSNYLRVRSFVSGGTYYVTLEKVVGGTATALSTHVSSASTLRLDTSGSTLSLYGNGALIATVTDATHQGAKRAGLWSVGGGIVSNGSINNFTATGS